MKWQEKLDTLRNSPVGSFENYCYNYLEWNRTAKSHGPYTLKNTHVCLVNFFDWCALREVRYPKEVTLSVLERYRAHVSGLRNKKDGKELSSARKHKKLSSVKDYFGWLVKKRVLLLNPSLDLELPKYVRKNIPHNVLSVEEAEKILSVPDVTNVFGLRDRAMLEVIYSTGIRRMELGNLFLSDLDFEEKTLLVREGKGKKMRLIPISERALEWVRKYLERSRVVFLKNAKEPYLFLNQRGKKMNPASITLNFTKFRDTAGIKKRQAVHIFRHTTASGMLDNGADIRHVQEMLGHAYLSTTQIYTHVAIRKLKEVYDKTHPSVHTPNSNSLVGGAEENTFQKIEKEVDTKTQDKDSNPEESNTS